MRNLLVALVMVSVVFAGCASKDSNEPTDPVSKATANKLVQTGLVAPDGANITTIEGGYAFNFYEAGLPFRHEFSIPEGATMVRFVADPIGAATVSVSMSHSDTGRRRCNQQSVVGYGQALVGERSCSSIAAIDPPGTNWTAFASGPASADVRVEFLGTPVDGIAGMLDLTQLSHATYDLEPTEYLEIPVQHPGTQEILLWAELTLPKGEGPWPVIIASSPYNGEKEAANRGVQPAMWTYWTQDWAKRGYATINVDVRGYGMSGGCVEIWGINEQLDQKFIVEWAARQPWSTGRVGFYGQSYVGTTPVEAAVHQAEGLAAIIAVAPVINSYEDWHYGGVPNGESSGSPVAYQVLTATPEVPSDPTQPTDMQAFIEHAGDGICDPDIVVQANDPRAIYNDFYRERDFKLGAKGIKAAVMFTEGFEDANVKSAMIPGWFNDIQAPKLGIFGHWLHQHPARMDEEVLFLGWMDQYVKGKPVGFENVPNAVISADGNWHRTADAWPPVGGEEATFGLNFGANALDIAGGAGNFALTLAPLQGQLPDDVVILRGKLDQALPLINPRVHLAGDMVGENGFVHAELYEEYADGGERLLTWGQLNLALRNGYDTYDPAVGAISGDLPLRPTEHIVAEGSTLRLMLRGVSLPVVGVAQPQPAQFTLDGAASALIVPTLPMSAYEVIPISALP